MPGLRESLELIDAARRVKRAEATNAALSDRVAVMEQTLAELEAFVGEIRERPVEKGLITATESAQGGTAAPGA